ncbi:hypothetical protein SXCC_04296 [Gluconacetobacter sp. SXCC-1]|nr:hypothetical protein SXCC_04296 [Gluconacetobacter sp. SXCC-1]
MAYVSVKSFGGRLFSERRRYSRLLEKSFTRNLFVTAV